MKTLDARLVGRYAVVLLICLGATVPSARSEETTPLTAASAENAPPPSSAGPAAELRKELEATRARLEALEKQLNALEQGAAGKTALEAVEATPTVDRVIEQLGQDAREALAQARRARQEAETEAESVQSEALAKALEAVVGAATVIELSVENMAIDDLERTVRDRMDDASARATLEGIRKVSRRLQERLREEVASLREAEARVRRARRQAGAWPDVVGEQETTDGDRVSFLSNSEVKPGDRVGNFVVFGGNGTVAGRVDGDAVVLGGDLRLKEGARVEGDAVVAGGDLRLNDSTRIGGDAVVVGGKIRAEEGAVVQGQRVQVSSSAMVGHMLKDAEEAEQTAEEDEEDSGLFGRIRHALATYLVLVGASLLSLTFAPVRMRNIAEMLEKKPKKSGLTGLLLLIALLPATLLLVVTIVGILAIPFVYAALLGASVAGVTALIMVIARKFPYRRRGQTAAGAVLWGAALLTLATLIPYLGTLIGIAALSVALGAFVISRAGQESPSDFPF